MIKVCVVIVTYNATPWINQCLSSLDDSCDPEDIFVVDNLSKDGTVDMIKSNFPKVRLIVSDANLGFGKANNLALELAYKEGYDFFFLLNQDAWFVKSDLKSLVEFHATNPEYGIISPIHLEKNKQELDRHFRGYMEKDAAGFLSDFHSSQSSDKMYPVNFVNAAAWSISRECLEKTGVFHPIFEHYGEDVNYVNRALFEGFKIGVYGGVSIIHDRNYGSKKAASTDTKRKFRRRVLNFAMNPSEKPSYLRTRLFGMWILMKYAFRSDFIPLMLWAHHEMSGIWKEIQNVDRYSYNPFKKPAS